jgi:riboflavin transporter FmnP
MNIHTTTLARIAMLSALVVVFDYTMKFSGLKIPFPWLPFLKFDFTGIPIMLSVLIINLSAGAFTSVVAFLAILVRSGEVIGASMKALAEFSTVLGFYAGTRILKGGSKLSWALSYVLGCTSRILIMFLSTIPVFTLYYGMPLSAALAISPMVATFNLIHGFISIFGGNLLYEALKRRVPSLISKPEDRNS